MYSETLQREIYIFQEQCDIVNKVTSTHRTGAGRMQMLVKICEHVITIFDIMQKKCSVRVKRSFSEYM